MARYIIKRLIYAILTLFVLITLVFFMMRMLPGDPFLGEKAISATALANMNAKYGLDKPVFIQYLMYMGNCLTGDLGMSITYNRPVTEIVTESFMVSADLGIRALIFATIAGILLGAIAAIKRGTIVDSLSMFVAMIGVSVPSFILGAVFQYFLGLQLRKALGMKSSCWFTRPQHICSPMLRSQCEELYAMVEDEIRKTSATRTRTDENLNQYLFLDYMNYKGLVLHHKISNKHFSVALASAESLQAFLLKPTRSLVCINDVHLSEERYESLRSAIIDAFESVFPIKSKYEKQNG